MVALRARPVLAATFSCAGWAREDVRLVLAHLAARARPRWWANLSSGKLPCPHFSESSACDVVWSSHDRHAVLLAISRKLEGSH